MRINLLVFILVVVLTFSFSGCKKMIVKSKQRKDLRELEQKRKEKDKEKMARYQEAVQRHASIQDKKTRKSMKKQYKKAQRHNNNKKEFFVKRWFKGKKRNQAKPQRGDRE